MKYTFTKIWEFVFPIMIINAIFARFYKGPLFEDHRWDSYFRLQNIWRHHSQRTRLVDRRRPSTTVWLALWFPVVVNLHGQEWNYSVSSNIYIIPLIFKSKSQYIGAGRHPWLTKMLWSKILQINVLNFEIHPPMLYIYVSNTLQFSLNNKLLRI